MNPTYEQTYAEQKEEIKALKLRLAEMGEVEIELHTTIIRLESEARGPEPYKTWQEAATAERMKRMDLNKTIRDMTARDEEAQYLVARWLEPGEKHDWTGFQKQVEKFLGVNQPEPIPLGIQWRTEQGNFYDIHNKGQGEAFLTKWYERRHEFPAYTRDCIGTWP